MKGSKKFISICVALLIGRTGFVMPLQTAAHDDAIIRFVLATKALRG